MRPETYPPPEIANADVGTKEALDVMLKIYAVALKSVRLARERYEVSALTMFSRRFCNHAVSFGDSPTAARSPKSEGH